MATVEDFKRTINGCTAKGDMPRALYWKGRLAAFEKDYSMAVSFYRQAADQGDAYGICELGRCYRHGQGVEVDLDQAHALARRAGEMSDYGGCCDTGSDYRTGTGAQKNLEEAARWYSKAATSPEINPAHRASALRKAADCYYESKQHNKALEVLADAIALVKDDIQYGKEYASCLDKAGFVEWARMRYPLSVKYWEKEQQVLYEYGKHDESFDYDTDPNVERVVKNVIIAKDRTDGLIDTGLDVLGGLL